MSLRILLLVAAGGAIGSVLRYLTGELLQRALGRGFPYATLSVNVLGSFCIGMAAVFLLERGNAGSAWPAFIIVGVLGGFTTFSSFSLDTLNLLRDGATLAALANVGLNVGLSLAACVAGYGLSRSLM